MQIEQEPKYEARVELGRGHTGAEIEQGKTAGRQQLGKPGRPSPGAQLDVVCGVQIFNLNHARSGHTRESYYRVRGRNGLLADHRALKRLRSRELRVLLIGHRTVGDGRSQRY